MSTHDELFLLKEQWRLRAHTAEEKVEKLEAHLELKDDRIVIQSDRNLVLDAELAELKARHQLLIDLVTKHEPSLRVLFEAISKEDKHE